jgi:hypothetical protein
MTVIDVAVADIARAIDSEDIANAMRRVGLARKSIATIDTSLRACAGVVRAEARGSQALADRLRGKIWNGDDLQCLPQSIRTAAEHLINAGVSRASDCEGIADEYAARAQELHRVADAAELSAKKADALAELQTRHAQADAAERQMELDAPLFANVVRRHAAAANAEAAKLQTLLAEFRYPEQIEQIYAAAARTRAAAEPAVTTASAHLTERADIIVRNLTAREEAHKAFRRSAGRGEQA